jgi:hypothetical protein
LWMGSMQTNGYGRFAYGTKQGGDRAQEPAHRVSYRMYVGAIPDKMFVCHRCDNPVCVNPDHLFVGTQFDNMRDMARKGRQVFQSHPERAARGDRHSSRTKPDRVAWGERHGSVVKPGRLPTADNHWSRRNPELVSRGSKNGLSVLNEAVVKEIRRLHATTGAGCAELAKMFGVSKSTTSCILLRKTWGHVWP